MLFDKNTEEKLQNFLEAKTETAQLNLFFKKVGVVFGMILAAAAIILLISTIFNAAPGIIRFSNYLK